MRREHTGWKSLGLKLEKVSPSGGQSALHIFAHQLRNELFLQRIELISEAQKNDAGVKHWYFVALALCLTTFSLALIGFASKMSRPAGQ